MDAPQDYKTAGIFMLVSGSLSLILGGIFLLSSLCMFIWAFLAVAAGIAEIVMGILVLQGKRMPAAMVVSIVGILGALTACNWIGVVMEVLAIVWLNKPEVKEWLASPA